MRSKGNVLFSHTYALNNDIIITRTNLTFLYLFISVNKEYGKNPLPNSTERVPYKLEIDQENDLLYIKKYMTVEWGDDQITNEEIVLDGTETKSSFYSGTRISKAGWDEDTRSIKISSSVKFDRGANSFEIKSTEDWRIQDEGKILKIEQASNGFRGEENKDSLIFEKE